MALAKVFFREIFPLYSTLALACLTFTLNHGKVIVLTSLTDMKALMSLLLLYSE